MCKEKAYQNQWRDASASREGEGPVEAGDSSHVARLDPTAQALIGHHLKAFYGQIVDEAVPQHLLELLDELERRERSGEKP